MLDEITAETRFTRIEEEVRRFWRRQAVPQAALAARDSGDPCVIQQQPLWATGQSVADQSRLLAVADLFVRYRSMRGDAVDYRAGWTCHGLPIEVAVERSLGPGLAEYDLARFNAACQTAVEEGIQQGEARAERLGVWRDPVRIYATHTPQAVSAVWGALRRLWETHALQRQCRVVSVCSRCATPLSMMEASRRWVEADAHAVWLRLPWDREPNAYFLVWTPVPWTLVGMVALAAHPDASYCLVEVPGHKGQPPGHLLLAEAALDRTGMAQFRPIRRLVGRSLRDAGYRPPFTFQPVSHGAGRIILNETVPLDRGTGLLPVTPGFDAHSLALAGEHDLPVPDLLDGWGSLVDSVTTWRGLSPLDAEPLIIDNLRKRGLVFRQQDEVRPRPLCPYCETPLLPQARDVWLVETPGGPWILGRDRAWGIPLPIWVCEQCQETTCVAGLDDLGRRTALDTEQIDLHRPGLDQITFPCQSCGGTMRRVAPVVDAALEAAVLPWVTEPLSAPAHLAVGLGDQQFGWPGDLAQATTLLGGTLAWEQALALPEGEGDAALDAERTPADVVRWAAYAQITPDQAERGFLRPLWRLVMSSHTDPPALEQKGAAEQLLDRWLMARLHASIGSLTEALDEYHPQKAAMELAALFDDAVGWYASHRPDGIGPVLGILCRLLAPFVPHLAEAMYRHTRGKTLASVHLSNWPLPDPAWEDRDLMVCIAQVRRLESLGQTARLQAGVKGDDLLREAVVCLPGVEDGGATELARCRELLAQILGVTQVRFTPEALGWVDWRLSLNPERALDRRVVPTAVEAALASLGPAQAIDTVLQLWAGRSVGLRVGGQAIALLPDEVRITAQAQAGWAAIADRCLLILQTG